ncbi:MAG: hypothetical protein WCK90_02700 [archaeon]
MLKHIHYDMFYGITTSQGDADSKLSIATRKLVEELGFSEGPSFRDPHNYPSDGCCCAPVEVDPSLRGFIRPYKAKEPDLAQIYDFRYTEGDHFVQHLSVAVATEFTESVKKVFANSGLVNSLDNMLKGVSKEVGKSPRGYDSWLLGFFPIESGLSFENKNYFREIYLRSRGLMANNWLIP